MQIEYLKNLNVFSYTFQIFLNTFSSNVGISTFHESSEKQRNIWLGVFAPQKSNFFLFMLSNVNVMLFNHMLTGIF